MSYAFSESASRKPLWGNIGEDCEHARDSKPGAAHNHHNAPFSHSALLAHIVMEMVASNALGETLLSQVVDTFCSLLAYFQVFAWLL